MVLFFFFKQKTAYEMRISDWSSDVCSSDLALRKSASATASSPLDDSHRRLRQLWSASRRLRRGHSWMESRRLGLPSSHAKPTSDRISSASGVSRKARPKRSSPPSFKKKDIRSEEHTSELQSLMRISYAVFCLKTKK